MGYALLICSAAATAGPGALYNWQGNDLHLQIYLQPRASKDEIIGPHGDALKIRITAAPVDGKANQHLCRFLAKIFAVPIGQVELHSGHHSRNKCVIIHNPQHLPGVISLPE